MRKSRSWLPNRFRRRRRRAPGAGLFMTGAGIGAAAALLLDPAEGKRRRHLLSDKAVRSMHVTTDATSAVSRDMANRMRGVAAMATSPLRAQDSSDAAVAARVRTQLGRVATHPRSIFVLAEDGSVTLSGPVLSGEADRIVSAVRSVPGVQSVDNALTEHSPDEGIPGLQGQPSERRMRGAFQQEVWPPALRLAAGGFGVGLVTFGLSRRGWFPKIPAVWGAILATRAITNLPLKRITGIGSGRRAVTVHGTVNISAPVDEVFGVWSNFERFPSFMDGVLEITTKPSGVSAWTVRGPLGAPVRFDTEVTRYEPDREIAWRTTAGSAVQHAGIVKFEPTGPNSTRIDVRMSYNPMAGLIGHAVAGTFGANPRQTIDEDLVRLKSLLEEGATTAHGRKVLADEIGPDGGTAS